MIPDFIAALKQEIEMTQAPPIAFDTLFFGGGTPSVLDAADIGSIVETVLNRFQFNADIEISMEINPGTVDVHKLKALLTAGVNRITIGAQSFQESELALLGRIHTAADSVSAIRGARRAGFDNIGIDLIYGTPGQSKTGLIRDLEMAVSFEPAHLSCYMLTYEPGTLIDEMRRRGDIEPLGESDAAALFELAGEYTASRGYIHYEISNFATSDAYKSRHNSKYWSFAPYIGLGPAAHSFIEPVRYWNHGFLKAYINSILQKKRPIEQREIIDREKRLLEAIYLGLRTSRGVEFDEFERMCGLSFTKRFHDLIHELAENGFASLSKDRFALTLKGMLFHEAVVDRFFYRLPEI